jgi:hypothetical protein
MLNPKKLISDVGAHFGEDNYIKCLGFSVIQEQILWIETHEDSSLI